jgi:1,4-alpha-glucan branching enzyme
MRGVIAHSLLTDFDVDLFRTGKHFNIQDKLGAHPLTLDGEDGVLFAVYAPHAKKVSVIGDFSDWKPLPLLPRWDSSGIWEGFVSGARARDKYKYLIRPIGVKYDLEKSDPYARYAEIPSRTASVVWQDDYHWNDHTWLATRAKHNGLSAPMAIYEMHLASWKRHATEHRPLTYLELSEVLPAYLSEMGYTHVELMPVMEHPYPPSWGYQITGFYAPTSRFGTPADFKTLVDALHQAGIGVILDWVPSHFPSDGHGLGKFDGSSVYEHPDWRKGYHPDWDSLIFDYGRPEVRSFLISNALFWLNEYHADGLRVDAVASMLYLDYSRKEDQWEPNAEGGRENLDAISFLKELNETIYLNHADVQMIAEESTAFPMVSHPVYLGGLGFGMKWMMGWMHDTLNYFKNPTIYRKFHHGGMSFSIYYAFSENYVLPFSHDEVVHGKASLLHKMPGDDWQKFANLRLLYAYMYTHPGAKLLFMGAEIAQRNEWNYADQLQWELLEHAPHQGIQKFVRDLNTLYRSKKALYEINYDHHGFEWIDYSDNSQSILSYLRKGKHKNDVMLVACNFTEVPRKEYQVGVPESGVWKEIFNSDAVEYGGSGMVQKGKIAVVKEKYHGREHSIRLTLPPLGVVILEPVPATVKKGGKKSAGVVKKVGKRGEKGRGKASKASISG